MSQSSLEYARRPSTGPSPGRVMGWLFLLASLFWPRVVILAFWIFGSTIGKAFSSWVIPAIGFVVAPWTTMTYAWMWGLSSHRVFGAEWIVVGLGVLLDVATWAGARRLLR